MQADWFASPLGRYVLQAEALACEHYLDRVFGFHAAQLGMPELPGLDVVRMPYRWLVLQPDRHYRIGRLNPAVQAAVHVWTQYDSLPFATASLDLLILPHALEWMPDPLPCLKELQRVLTADGAALIFGFNPRSIWRMTSHSQAMPSDRHWHSMRSLIRHLHGLHFDTESEHLACYSPPVQNELLIRQGRYLDALSNSIYGTIHKRLGSKFSGIGSGVYCLTARKRTAGIRTIRATRRRSRTALGSGALSPLHSQKVQQHTNQYRNRENRYS